MSPELATKQSGHPSGHPKSEICGAYERIRSTSQRLGQRPGSSVTCQGSGGGNPQPRATCRPHERHGVCCGTGLLSFELRGDVGPITLADSSEGMLEVLRDKIAASGATNMTPMKLDLAADPLPADRFDLVYNLMTLHHIPDTERALRSFHALLRPNGWLAICDLDKEDGSFHDPGFDGHKGFDRSVVEQKLRDLGCLDVYTVTAYELERERGGMKRVYPLFLLLGRKAAA